MKYHLTLLLDILLVILFTAGCATRKEIVKFKEDVTYLKLQMNVLRAENEAIAKELSGLKKSVDGLSEDNRRLRADLLSEMGNMKNQTQNLDSKLEDTSYRMSKLLNTVEESASVKTSPDSAAVQSNQPSGIEISEPVHQVSANDLYNIAYLDLSSGNYQLARQGFQEYVNRFPNGELADNAQYWIGETYYTSGDYKTASSEFKKVITNYPRGKKVTSALLKMGYCALKSNDVPSARMHFNSIIKNFPNSEEAALAKARLEELNR